MEGSEFKYQEFAMPPHASPRSASRNDDPAEMTNIQTRGAVDIASLLQEVRSILSVSPILYIFRHHSRKNAALVHDIDAYLQGIQPTPLGRATEAAARLMGMPDRVMVNPGETHVATTRAGVWLQARLLVEWNAILPLLPIHMSSSYAAAIAALPAAEREVFLLHRMGGLVLADIARMLDRDASGCERLLGKALAAIARHIDTGEGNDVGA